MTDFQFLVVMAQLIFIVFGIKRAIELLKAQRNQTIDECIRQLGGRYGAAAKKDLQSLKNQE